MSSFNTNNIHNIPVNQYIINIDDTTVYGYTQDKIINILNNTIGTSYKCAILYVVINPDPNKSSLKPKIYQFLTDSDGNIFKIFHEGRDGIYLGWQRKVEVIKELNVLIEII